MRVKIICSYCNKNESDTFDIYDVDIILLCITLHKYVKQQEEEPSEFARIICSRKYQ